MAVQICGTIAHNRSGSFNKREGGSVSLSEARKRANAKYNAKTYDRIEAKVQKGQKEVIQAHADKHDGSLNKFLNRAIIETMAHDKEPE